MVYNELEQGDILSEVRIGLATIAYADMLLRSIWVIHKIRQTPVNLFETPLHRNNPGFLSPFGDMTLWNILVSCVVLPYLSPYSRMTNRMLWGHIRSVAQSHPR